MNWVGHFTAENTLATVWWTDYNIGTLHQNFFGISALHFLVTYQPTYKLILIYITAKC